MSNFQNDCSNEDSSAAPWCFFHPSVSSFSSCVPLKRRENHKKCFDKLAPSVYFITQNSCLHTQHNLDYLAHAGRDINLIYPCPRYLCPSLSGTKKHKCEKYNITLFFNRLHGVLH